MGKGGVGKTTVSLGAASAWAQASKKVLYLEIGEKGAAGQLLKDVPLLYTPRKLAKNLWGAKLTGEESLREYLLRRVRLEKIYRLFFENRPVRYFFEVAPALRDLMVLGKIVHEMDQPDNPGPYDHIVIDAPATGHGIFLLKTPHIVQELTRLGPVFDRARHIASVLRSPEKCQIHVVTLPRPIVIGETLDLFREIQKVGGPLGTTIVNRFVGQELRPIRSARKKQVRTSRSIWSLLEKRAQTESREIRRIQRMTQTEVQLLPELENGISLFNLGRWFEEGFVA